VNPVIRLGFAQHLCINIQKNKGRHNYNNARHHQDAHSQDISAIHFTSLPELSVFTPVSVMPRYFLNLFCFGFQPVFILPATGHNLVKYHVILSVP
jgi:hypothetical protein